MTLPIIFIGFTSGLWSVTAGPRTNPDRTKSWFCTCKCGTEKWISQWRLMNSKAYSCGCERLVTETTRQKLSEARMGQTQSEETKQKISAAHMGKKRPGFSAWTPERRARLAASKPASQD